MLWLFIVDPIQGGTGTSINTNETIHALYKRNRSLQPNCGFSTYKE
ncbi:aspartate ammonia-lyase [Bacillus cereus R309803]|nr:aspartate ammonia-lyase [Bacillus cereus R309803]